MMNIVGLLLCELPTQIIKVIFYLLLRILWFLIGIILIPIYIIPPGARFYERLLRDWADWLDDWY